MGEARENGDGHGVLNRSPILLVRVRAQPGLPPAILSLLLPPIRARARAYHNHIMPDSRKARVVCHHVLLFCLIIPKS